MRLAQATQDAIVAEHLDHPALTPARLHAWLTRRYAPKYRIPSARAIARALEERGHVKPAGRPLPRGHKPPVRGARAPNQVWCVTVGDDIPCGDGERVGWMALVDGFTGYIVRLEALYRSTPLDSVFRGAWRASGMPDEVRTRHEPPWIGDDPGGLTDLVVWLLRAGVRVHRAARSPFVTVDPGITSAAERFEVQRRLDAYRKQWNQQPGPSSYVRSPRPVYTWLADTRVAFELEDNLLADDAGRIRFRGRRYDLGEAVGRGWVSPVPWDRDRWELKVGTVSLGLIDLRDRERGLIRAPILEVLTMRPEDTYEEVDWDQLVPGTDPILLNFAPLAARSGSRRARSRSPKRKASTEPTP